MSIPKSVFQSTLPREERQSNHASTNMSDDFNPRSHERSDDVLRCRNKSRFTFQSTLPREERPNSHDNNSNKNYISIHAPTRGATCVHFYQLHLAQISIHAPTRGATCPFLSSFARLSCISIHAPTRGATHCVYKYLSIGIFQSTLPREERRVCISISYT